MLEKELNPSSDPVLASPTYRRTLAQALFYKVGGRTFTLIFMCTVAYFYTDHRVVKKKKKIGCNVM